MTNVLAQSDGKNWTAYNADNIDVVRSLPDSSVGYSIYSIPFADLYTYSASERDMGNCRDHEQFMRHFAFLLDELLRVTKPGRNMSIHCMPLPTLKSRDGYIGIIDFPGMLVQACVRAGWIWHSQTIIRKDPVTSMQRTKALGLLHKQIKKDSAMSRMTYVEELLTFQKPGVNPEPVEHATDIPVEVWQQWAEAYWGDINPSDTLQYRSAREHEDEKHICPLQLPVYLRAMTLWSNPGDVVLEPFGGIGSGGWIALGAPCGDGQRLMAPRRVVLCELKESYYKQAVMNLQRAEREANAQVRMFG